MTLLTLALMAALFIGLTLGLIGGGGSILTVPVLTYLLGLGAREATAYSLFIVGMAASVGAYRFWRNGQVDFRQSLWLGIPALISVYFARAVVVPLIPEVLWEFESWVLTDDLAFMLVFAIVMVISSVAMIRGRGEQLATGPVHPFGLAFAGLFIGLLTGMLGAGGGFVIIPTLMFVGKLPVKKAMGTSLVIITINSLFGFLTDILNASNVTYQVDWALLLQFVALALVGILAGARLNKHVSGGKLKVLFGWFVLVMGLFILVERLQDTFSQAPENLELNQSFLHKK
ncbi:TSUP family transporter [Persicobacter diffluens]|uniref:Probable membrane transporter protein n=1 Tax=Persicobacter diffluens TaxID=981 RepID=A0AAN5APE3_9BACT|nr:UPF0721 transmembrane protein [Persicobacter diffluens]